MVDDYESFPIGFLIQISTSSVGLVGFYHCSDWFIGNIVAFCSRGMGSIPDSAVGFFSSWELFHSMYGPGFIIVLCLYSILLCLFRRSLFFADHRSGEALQLSVLIYVVIINSTIPEIVIKYIKRKSKKNNINTKFWQVICWNLSTLRKKSTLSLIEKVQIRIISLWENNS